MLTFIKELIKKYICDYQPNIFLEEFELFGDEKASATISSTHLMGSIEILKDFTTDLLIVEFESENIVYSKTFENVNDDEELKEIIKEYLKKVDAYEKNYKS